MLVRETCVSHGGVVRHGMWRLVCGVSAWLALACSDGSGATSDASGSDEADPPAPPGPAVAPVIVAELRPPATGVAPDMVDLLLSSNIDSLTVRTKITDPSGVALSDCQVTDVYRVGPSAVSWPIGGSLALPVAYDAALPDGRYVHAVSLGIGAFGNHWLQKDFSQFFGVSGGVFHSLSAEELEDLPGAGDVAPADPCPAFAAYSDEIPVDGATSRIDLDSWQDLGTIQPLRWLGSATRPFVGPLPSLLIFHALLAGRGRIQLDLITPSDDPADFDAVFPEDGRVVLDEIAPDGVTAQTWATLGGRASVRIDERGRARVELADLVFSRSRRAGGQAGERSVASASLVGDVITEQWP